MLKTIVALAALFAAAAAFPQNTLSPASQQVQLLGPQLVAFTGSAGNFESLVTGLTGGTPVTLTTIGADGFIQIVTFVPGSVLSPLDTARNLETARQNLIARGVAVPTAQQLAISLMGGTLVSAPGSSVAVQGVLQTALLTSTSPLTNTSNTPGFVTGTSNTPSAGTTITPVPAVTSASEVARPAPPSARGSASSGGTTT